MMNLLGKLILLVTPILCWPEVASAQRAVFLVRHAEKQGDDLTDKGKAQSQALAKLLDLSGITKVYISQFERTKLTASPLVDKLADRGISVQVETEPLPEGLLADPEDRALLKAYAEAVAGRLRTEAPQGIVLVVGHDLTVPAIIEALGVKSSISIQSKEFDRLFLVIPGNENERPGLFQLQHYAH